MRPLGPEDAQLGKAVFASLLGAARRLNFFEMSQLRSAYQGTTSYEQLSDNVKRKLVDVGLAAINTGIVQRKG